jgi:hypothetical protein
MTNCIDIEKRFGDRYKIRREQSYQAEHGNGGRVRDPWAWVILCRHGHVYPHGGDRLAASTDRLGRIANRLAKLRCVRVVQDGDDGINAVFHVGDFDRVAAVMKPRLRRRLSRDRRAKQVERLRPFRFTRATHDAGGGRTHEMASSADTEPILMA